MFLISQTQQHHANDSLFPKRKLLKKIPLQAGGTLSHYLNKYKIHWLFFFFFLILFMFRNHPSCKWRLCTTSWLKRTTNSASVRETSSTFWIVPMHPGGKASCKAEAGCFLPTTRQDSCDAIPAGQSNDTINPTQTKTSAGATATFYNILYNIQQPNDSNATSALWHFSDMPQPASHCISDLHLTLFNMFGQVLFSCSC